MILVTGGTGLVGSHLLYHLTQKNALVCAIYRSKEKIEKVKEVFSFYTDDYLPSFKKIKWIKADITDIPSLEIVFSMCKVSNVYHCAGLVSFNPKDYYKMRQVNINGTANIVNFCVDEKVKKLCFVSSISTLGSAINGKVITEDNKWNKEEESSEYAITKHGAEMEVWRASQEGIDVVIVNPGVILGSGFFNTGSGKIFSQVYNGFKFYTEGITGFVGVKDVVKAMISLTESTIKNQRFILVSENKSFKDIFFSIAKEFNKKPPSIKVNTIITSVFWRIDWLLTKITKKEPLLTKNSARSSHNKEYYSSEKIKNELNFEFEKMNKVIVEACKNFV